MFTVVAAEAPEHWHFPHNDKKKANFFQLYNKNYAIREKFKCIWNKVWWKTKAI